jgi:HK97 family phage major capsid protein
VDHEEQITAKIKEIEEKFGPFVSGVKDRLVALEQHATRPTGGPGAGGAPGTGEKAELDPVLGLPILTKSHRLVDNLPGNRDRSSEQKLNFGKWLRGAVTGNWTNAEAEQKALTTAGTGGALVLPEILGAELIDLARANVVCMAAGARTIPLGTGKATMPTLTTDVVGAWQAGELADIAVADPVIGPTDVATKTFACYIPKIAVQLFEDATDLLGHMLQDAFMRSFAVALDAAALKGVGTNAPLGLLNNGGVSKTSVAGGQITGDEISNAIKAIGLRNFTPNAYIYNPEAEAEINQKKASTSGVYLGVPADVAKLAKFVTSAADNDAFVGDFTRMIFFIRTPVTVEVSRVGDGDAWKSLAVSIRAYLRADVVCTHLGAFEVLTNFGS